MNPFSALRNIDASVVITSLTSAGKSYVNYMFRQLVVWNSIARAIINSKGPVQAVATDRKWQSLRYIFKVYFISVYEGESKT